MPSVDGDIAFRHFARGLTSGGKAKGEVSIFFDLLCGIFGVGLTLLSLGLVIQILRG